MIFTTKRGLRQEKRKGTVLDAVADESKFQYHYNCEKTKLTHLCFAHDLLIFIDGFSNFVQVVLKILRELLNFIFLSSGLSPLENMLISFSTGIMKRTFPMKYPGLQFYKEIINSKLCPFDSTDERTYYYLECKVIVFCSQATSSQYNNYKD